MSSSSNSSPTSIDVPTVANTVSPIPQTTSSQQQYQINNSSVLQELGPQQPQNNIFQRSATAFYSSLSNGTGGGNLILLSMNQVPQPLLDFSR